MIISSRTKIRLSRNLTAQTTPYPHANTWVKRGFFLLTVILVAGVYLAAKPEKNIDQPQANKEILGQQQPAELGIYEIKRGDTLFNVSQKYGISWQTLAEINNLREPYVLKIGQKLKTPASSTRLRESEAGQ